MWAITISFPSGMYNSRKCLGFQPQHVLWFIHWLGTIIVQTGNHVPPFSFSWLNKWRKSRRAKQLWFDIMGISMNWMTTFCFGKMKISIVVYTQILRVGDSRNSLDSLLITEKHISAPDGQSLRYIWFVSHTLLIELWKGKGKKGKERKDTAEQYFPGSPSKSGHVLDSQDAERTGFING